MSDLGLDMKQLMNFESLGLPGSFDAEEDRVSYDPLVLTPVESHPEDRNIDLQRDYNEARQNIHFQNQMMMDAAKIYLELAKNSESPRFLQAFNGLMQQMSNNNKELLNIHKDMKKITEEAGAKKKDNNAPAAPVNIQNATVFMGSPSDLMDEIEDEEARVIEGETV